MPDSDIHTMFRLGTNSTDLSLRRSISREQAENHDTKINAIPNASSPEAGAQESRDAEKGMASSLSTNQEIQRLRVSKCMLYSEDTIHSFATMQVLSTNVVMPGC